MIFREAISLYNFLCVVTESVSNSWHPGYQEEFEISYNRMLHHIQVFQINSVCMNTATSNKIVPGVRYRPPTQGQKDRQAHIAEVKSPAIRGNPQGSPCQPGTKAGARDKMRPKDKAISSTSTYWTDTRLHAKLKLWGPTFIPSSSVFSISCRRWKIGNICIKVIKHRLIRTSSLPNYEVR